MNIVYKICSTVLRGVALGFFMRIMNPSLGFLDAAAAAVFLLIFVDLSSWRDP